MKNIAFFRRYSIPLMEIKHTIKLFLIFPIVFILYLDTPAEIRYVSKTGLSLPPYTSWPTAADSIQKVIDISTSGDTIYVGPGVYKEHVQMKIGISLLGTNMDSCIINTSDFLTAAPTIEVNDSCKISNFTIISRNDGVGIHFARAVGLSLGCTISNNKIVYGLWGIWSTGLVVTIYKNIIIDCDCGLSIVSATTLIADNFVLNCRMSCDVNFCEPLIINNTMISNQMGSGVSGYSSGFYVTSRLYNNLIINGGSGIDAWNLEMMYNNIISASMVGIHTQNGDSIINNVIMNSQKGISNSGSQISTLRYNDLWRNVVNTQNITPDSTTLLSDPMFVNDTSDFHLQMFSPLIDAGDPNILDKDGSRSDIGLFGGPYGESYTYQDLAPRAPVNVTAVYDTNEIRLTWNKNTEAVFKEYKVYCDTSAGFIPDSLKMVSIQEDTVYITVTPSGISHLYYKLTTVDSQGNESAPSDEIAVILSSSSNNPFVVNDYKLYQNYPNPFNPSTKISYRLKERGYVKLYVYDIKGEVIKVLVNKWQEKGYYEVQFTGDSSLAGFSDEIASGIYIYQIIIKGERDIPVYSDMKKMIYLK